MRKLFFVALSFLFASSAFGTSAWVSQTTDAKGMFSVKIVNGGTTKNYAWPLSSSSHNGVILLGTGTPGTELCDTGASEVCSYVINPAVATTVTVRLSGKVTDWGNATGSGSIEWTYTGTGLGLSESSKKEHGLAYAPVAHNIDETWACCQTDPSISRTAGLEVLWAGADNCE